MINSLKVTDFCPKHPRNLRDLFCMTDKERLCSQCMLLENHRSHEIISEERYLQRDEYINEARSRLKFLQTKLETKAQAYEQNLRSAKNSIDSLNSQIAALEKQLVALRA